MGRRGSQWKVTNYYISDDIEDKLYNILGFARCGRVRRVGRVGEDVRRVGKFRCTNR